MREVFTAGASAGKSSLLNSWSSAMKGRLSQSQLAMGSSDSSITKKLRKIPLAGSRLVVWDTMGWDEQSYKAGEVGYILDGNIPDGFDLTQPIHVRYMSQSIEIARIYSRN